MSAGRAGSIFTDPRFVLQTTFALAAANARYWTTVAPTVRNELRRWRDRARGIEDPELRSLALAKLRAESFHAQAAAMLATGAARHHRRSVVEAIVALELLFDYLDGLTERPYADPLADRERLFRAYVDAVALPPSGTGVQLEQPLPDDGGYLHELSTAVDGALRRLPAASAITDVAQHTAARSAQAQTRMHAATQLGPSQVEQWARDEAEGTDLHWHELLPGAASSVLALHALIAAAADPATTRQHAADIVAAYLPACVLLTLLDGLVDRDDDIRAGDPQPLGYLSFFENPEELGRTLTGALRRAGTAMRTLPRGPRHVMVLVGLLAYYTSAPGAHTKLARPISAHLQKQLRPLIFPALALMRGWRLAKRLRAGNRRASSIAGLASSMGQSHPGTGGCNEI